LQKIALSQPNSVVSGLSRLAMFRVQLRFGSAADFKLTHYRTLRLLEKEHNKNKYFWQRFS
jgi:hypothetical protein